MMSHYIQVWNIYRTKHIKHIILQMWGSISVVYRLDEQKQVPQIVPWAVRCDPGYCLLPTRKSPINAVNLPDLRIRGSRASLSWDRLDWLLEHIIWWVLVGGGAGAVLWVGGVRAAGGGGPAGGEGVHRRFSSQRWTQLKAGGVVPLIDVEQVLVVKGVLLRDSHGVAQVSVLSARTLFLLLIHYSALRKHLEPNRKDKEAKFCIILFESRTHSWCQSTWMPSVCQSYWQSCYLNTTVFRP